MAADLCPPFGMAKRRCCGRCHLLHPTALHQRMTWTCSACSVGAAMPPKGLLRGILTLHCCMQSIQLILRAVIDLLDEVNQLGCQRGFA